MKDATTITALAAVILVLVAVIALIAQMYSRLGQVEAEIRHSQERMDAQHQETLEEIRRLTDALGSHSHTPEGEVIFTIPPPRASDGPAHSQPGQAIIPTPAPDQPAPPR